MSRHWKVINYIPLYWTFWQSQIFFSNETRAWWRSTEGKSVQVLKFPTKGHWISLKSKICLRNGFNFEPTCDPSAGKLDKSQWTHQMQTIPRRMLGMKWQLPWFCGNNTNLIILFWCLFSMLKIQIVKLFGIELFCF